jgi:hypothetical protein
MMNEADSTSSTACALPVLSAMILRLLVLLAAPVAPPMPSGRE